MKHVLFPADELEPGQLRAAEVDGIAIVVARTPAGKFHALRDVCPHLGARLSDGALEKFIGSPAVGDYEITETIVLRCPWHTYEFDLDNGACIGSPKRLRTRVYPVEIEHGQVVVQR